MINELVKIICNYFGFEPEILNSKTRKREIVQLRQICHYFANKYLDKNKYPSGRIGKEIGNKDHSTVLYSIKVVNNLIDIDRLFASDIESIDNIIKSNLSRLKACEITISEDEIREAIVNPLIKVLQAKIKYINKIKAEIKEFSCRLNK